MKRFSLISMCVSLSLLMPLSAWSQEGYAVVKDGTITFYHDSNKETRDGKSYDVTKELAYGYPSWLSDNLKIAVFDDSFSDYTPSTVAWLFNGCSNLTEVKNLSNLNLSAATDMSNMFAGCSSLEKLDLRGLSTGNIKNMQGLFYRCSGLKDINLQGIDTKNVESLFQMFNQCGSLEQLDLSSFNTSNVEDMTRMFFNCQKLQTIYVGDEWTTLYVSEEKHSDMFLGCSMLVGGNGTKCDGFGFSNPIDDTYARVDTSDKPGYFTSVPKAYAVVDGNILTFYYDGKKTSRSGNVYDIATEYVGDGDFPAWQNDGISKVSFDSSFLGYFPTSTARWFHSCSSVTEIEGIEYLNTSETISMAGMFYDCSSLSKIDLNGFKTSNVTTMYCMFYGCSMLESLDMSSFDTQNVTTMAAMFYGCLSLKEINMGSFDTKSVDNMEYMFFNCSNLKTIFVGDGWSTEKLTMATSHYMFWGCSSLVGGDGTKCDGIALINHLYAKIDDIEEGYSPGYFTSGINTNQILSDNKIQSMYYYSLDGKRSILPLKGLNINSGKKIIVR